MAILMTDPISREIKLKAKRFAESEKVKPVRVFFKEIFRQG